MKRSLTRWLAVIMVAASIAMGAHSTRPAIAQVAPVGTGDVTSILGSSPFFPNGYRTDINGSWYKQLVDSTASTPAVVGKLLVYSGANKTWAQSATANQALPFGLYGVVQTAASAQGGIAQVQVRGLVSAYCTTSAAPAIAAGSLLVADGSGNLTTPATLSAPSSGSATPFGTTGAATVTYQAYARNLVSLDSAASSNISTSTANATLSGTNGIAVSMTIPAGSYFVAVNRSAGGPSQGLIGVFPVSPLQTSFSFVDYGIPASAAYAAPTTPSPAVPGVLLGVAVGTLAAGTSTPTLTQVMLGGGY